MSLKFFRHIPLSSARVAPTKQINFRKSSKGEGRGEFSIQKFIFQILDLSTGLVEKIAVWFSENEGGGASKTVWNFSEKFIRFEAPAVPNRRRKRYLYVPKGLVGEYLLSVGLIVDPFLHKGTIFS